jgi:hypothetical protein
MRTMTSILVFGLLFTFLAIHAASAAEWGSLKGRFVVDGTPTKLVPLMVNKDPFCINNPPPNDTVVIGKNNALVNAIVYVRTPLGKKIEINPEYEAKLKQPAVLDNNGCSFHPHILTARVGQTIVIKNSDPVGHNTNLSLLSYNPIVEVGGKKELIDSADSVYPSPVNCNIHTWMKAYLVSLKHPYVAVSGQDGTFEIKDLPAGTNEFQFWHEAPGNLKNVRFKGGVTDPKGRAKITIPAGKTLDLGDMKISASVLK